MRWIEFTFTLLGRTVFRCLYSISFVVALLFGEISFPFEHDDASNFAQEMTKKIRAEIDFDRIGKINKPFRWALEKSINKMSEVKVVLSLAFNYHLSSDRLTDYYFFNQNFAILNKEWFAGTALDSSFSVDDLSFQVTQARIGIVLHILLGGSGQYDENYNKTLSLFLLSDCFSKTKKSTICLNDKSALQLIDLLIPEYVDQFQFAGGSTGVSGGGDLMSLLLKIGLVENFLVHTSINDNCKYKPSQIICRVWPTMIDYVRTLYLLDIESVVDGRKQLNESMTSLGHLRIQVPKIPIVMSELNSLNDILLGQKIEITSRMIVWRQKIDRRKLK